MQVGLTITHSPSAGLTLLTVVVDAFSAAVTSIRSGGDIKTVQGNLGHATAAFTLDVYGHVTDQMKQESANRMDSYIKNVLGQ